MAIQDDKTISNYHKTNSKNTKSLISILIIFFVAIMVSAGILIFRQKEHNFNRDDNAYSKSIVDSDPSVIPDYNGDPYVNLNDGIPNFTKYDLENIKGESYSELDKLGRCGTAVAMIDKSMMPTEKRGSIRRIKPSGWVQKKYPGIVSSNPPYLYNRCHLIAHGLTGQNDNERNLITGTRYFNAELMLPFEIQVMDYIKKSENHTLYRVSPYFANDELLARGVEIETYSVEDNGKEVCFHVFVYNIQPGIKLNYKTGESEAESKPITQLNHYDVEKLICYILAKSKNIKECLHKHAA